MKNFLGEEIKLNMIVRAYAFNNQHYEPTECIIMDFGQGFVLSPIDDIRTSVPINKYLTKNGTLNMVILEEDYFKD